jgi:hypothetical protein
MKFIYWLQSRLTAHGFPVGSIDGVMGDITTSAVKMFQSHKNLVVTGTATQDTIMALRRSSSSDEKEFDRDMVSPIGVGKPNILFPHQNNVKIYYGEVGTNQTPIEPVWPMRLAWDKRKYISKMTLHKKVAPSALRAMRNVFDHYKIDGVRRLGLDLFGGSLNVRRMRGGSRYSMHSWGIAIDFDPERNRLRWSKPKARLSQKDVRAFWECWEDEGWTSLGRRRDYDWMHVQAAHI